MRSTRGRAVLLLLVRINGRSSGLSSAWRRTPATRPSCWRWPSGRSVRWPRRGSVGLRWRAPAALLRRGRRIARRNRGSTSRRRRWMGPGGPVARLWSSRYGGATGETKLIGRLILGATPRANDHGRDSERGQAQTSLGQVRGSIAAFREAVSPARRPVFSFRDLGTYQRSFSSWTRAALPERLRR